jgi:hypothetical protein
MYHVRVFGNRALESVFGLKREEVTRDWRKLHNEPRTLCPEINVIRKIKLKRMKWAGM